MPNTGGEYVYYTRCFGPWVGFMFGWAQLFIIRTSAAAALALIIVDYAGYFVPLQGTIRIIAALAIIFLFGLFNYIGIQQASVVQKISTVLKVAGLMSIVIIGFFFSGGHENLLSTRAAPQETLGPLGSLVAVLMLIVFSHTGWERIGYAAGEMKNPRRVIPASLIIGISIVISLYALTNMTYHKTLGMEGMRQSTIVASDVLTILIGPVGAAYIAILAIVSAAGSINGTMMTAPRAYYAMANDGLFFKWLDHVHPHFRTPARAIVAHCVWAGTILIIRGTFQTIAGGLAFAILIFYGLAVIALFKMRKEGIGGTDIFRVPLYPYLPLLLLILVCGLIVFRAVFEWQNSLIDMAFIATGIPFAFYWCRRRNEKQGKQNGSKEE
jgi:APA family basic amino acid/polyamine antiporter